MTAIYEQCRTELGRLWHGRTNTYGRLSLAAAPTDINATNDDDALMTYGVRSMCDRFGWIATTSQVRSQSPRMMNGKYYDEYLSVCLSVPGASNPPPTHTHTMGGRSTLHIRHSEAHFTFHAAI